MIQEKYSSLYSENKFWEKITTIPEKTGCSVLRAAFTLYVLLKESSTPLWAKTSIVGALGYLICPLDAVPDPIPGIGFADDLAIMALVISQLYAYIDDDIRKKVDAKLPKRCRGVYIDLTNRP